MEQIAKEGFNPADYIRWYNLRSYDRINAPASMLKEMEQRVSHSPRKLDWSRALTSAFLSFV